MKSGSNYAFLIGGGFYFVIFYKLLAFLFPNNGARLHAIAEFYMAPFGKSLVSAKSFEAYQVLQGKVNKSASEKKPGIIFVFLWYPLCGLSITVALISCALANLSFFFLVIPIPSAFKFLALIPTAFNTYDLTPVPTALVLEIEKAGAKAQFEEMTNKLD